jgi:hypothetical protein
MTELTRPEEMTPAQRQTWDAILDFLCSGDDPVHICGQEGYSLDDTSPAGGRMIHCLSPGGWMRIGVTDEQFASLA